MKPISVLFGKTSLITLVVCALFLPLAGTTYADPPHCGSNPEASVFVKNPEKFELTKKGSKYHLTVKLGPGYESVDKLDVWPALDESCTESAGTWECDYRTLTPGFENIIVVDFIKNMPKSYAGICINAWVKGFLLPTGANANRPQSQNFVYTDETPEHVALTGIILNERYYDASDSEVAEVVESASEKLYAKSGVGLQLHKIKRINAEHSSIDLFAEIDAYAADYQDNIPDYVVIFSTDESVRWSNGGWALTSSQNIYCNHFTSVGPFGNDYIYGAVIDFDASYGKCGYDREKYYKTGELEHISNVSLDDGSCKGQAGVPCVYNNNTELYICGSIDFQEPFLKDKKSYVSSIIGHELLHQFGDWGESGEAQHFGSYQCDTHMGGSEYQNPPFAAQEYLTMCPYTFANLANSYNPNPSCD
jgi:hypothetical protein